MSLQQVMFVLDRVFKDPNLMGQFIRDPQATLARVELDEAEREAIVSGNREQLIAIGLDERVAGWILRPSPSKES